MNKAKKKERRKKGETEKYWNKVEIKKKEKGVWHKAQGEGDQGWEANSVSPMIWVL